MTDITGAALPGVDITVVNQETGARLQTLTNETGAYRVGSLPPGAYRIEAEFSGFDRLTRGPITLQVSQTIAIDLMLQVGQIGTTVDITESAPLIESQSSDIGQAIPEFVAHYHLERNHQGLGNQREPTDHYLACQNVSRTPTCPVRALAVPVIRPKSGEVMFELGLL